MANLTKIEKCLKSLGINYKFIELGAEIFRVEDVVKAGVKMDQVVKTLLIRSEFKRGLKFEMDYVALAVRGADRLNFKKIKRLFGTKAEMAKPEEVLKVVKVPVGAVCPIEIGVPVYFDRKVLKLKNVNLGSGDLTRGLDMSLEDLLKAVGKFEVADLV
ncbi:MAG TPA: YbaK/EbsC family protein [Candidatus Saccharimonadales bacterium]|nr:YbaK/EbsC family protein [Candidatus Saccharimonadales bacterium]